MKIDYQLTKQDYIDFNIFHMNHSKTIKKTLFIHRYIVSLVFLALPFVLSGVSYIPIVFWLVPSVVVYILWVIFYPKYFIGIVKRRLSKMLDEGKNTIPLGRQNISITDDGITEITDHSEAKHGWNVVEDIFETKEHIFVYISAVTAHIIPVRAFKSAEEKNALIEMVNARITKNK